MQLDAHTLLVVAMLANASLAAAHIWAWFQHRGETALLWMSAAIVQCCASAVLRETLPDAAAIVFANALLSLGLCSIATACRSLSGRPPSALGLIAAPLAWIAACAAPAIMADQNLRILISSASCAMVMAWAGLELRRERRQRVAAQYGVLLIVWLQGIAAVIRMIGAILRVGQPSQIGVARTADLIPTTLWSFGFLSLAGLGVILSVKERAELRLRQAVGQDPLTGIANRRRFDEALDAALVRTERSGSRLSLIMIDADAFKPYNDMLGHAEGDLALRAIALALTTLTDGVDGLAARYGGEEFIVLLPETDRAGALQFAKAVCGSVRDLHIAHPGSEHGRLTVSVGCATTSSDAGLRAADLLLSADRALYAAKHAGRNCVRWRNCPDFLAAI